MLLSKSIGILGCGWLGLPLAEHLLSLGHQVKGTTTSEKRINTLRSKNVNPYLVTVSEEEIFGDLEFFKTLDKLIISMPPGLRSNPNRRFDLMITKIKETCIRYKITEVIFISSTSVYGKLTGLITEKSKTKPATNSGKQLLLCENILFETTEFDTTILRMGGLIGPQRYPVIQLSKKPSVDNPNGSINLIHLTDCIYIISNLLVNETSKNVYNCVTPYHPSRKDYYDQMAHEIGCKPPLFKGSELFDRKISSQKLSQELNYKFRVKNLLISSKSD